MDSPSPSDRKQELRRRMLSDLKAMLPGCVLCALFLFFLSVSLGKTCPSRLIFGIPCPACGLTRAAVFLIKGQLYASLEANPFLLPLMAGIPIYIYEHYFKNRKARFFTAYMILCIILMVLVYLIRMALWFPDREPMIYEPDNLFAHMTDRLRMLPGLAEFFSAFWPG